MSMFNTIHYLAYCWSCYPLQELTNINQLANNHAWKFLHQLKTWFMLVPWLNRPKPQVAKPFEESTTFESHQHVWWPKGGEAWEGRRPLITSATVVGKAVVAPNYFFEA